MLSNGTNGLIHKCRIDLRHTLIFSLRNQGFYTHVVSKPNSETQKASKFGKTSNALVYFNSQITKCGRNGNLEGSEAVFRSMPHKNAVSWTAMITAYADNGKIGKARKLFDEMPDRTTASYNAMITACIKNKCDVSEAIRLFLSIPEKNSVSYAAMITGFIRAGMFDEAEKLYSETPVKWQNSVSSNALINGYLKSGKLEEAVRIFEGMAEKDLVSYSSMIDGYCKMGSIVDARGLFDTMPEKNVVTWTAMIDGYFKAGSFEDGFGLFLTMRRAEDVKVNSTTLTVIFEACGNFKRFREGTQVHGLVSRMGLEFDVFLGNSMISMYCKFGSMDAANAVFTMMSKKDIVSWNSLLTGFVQHDQFFEAYELFEKMPRKDVVSWTNMIIGLSGKGNISKCLELFKMMPEKDGIAWTAVITGFVANEEYEEALCWFAKMLHENVCPNPSTFSCVLSASAYLAALNQGLQIHAGVVKLGMECKLSVQNSLVSMYSKCGNTYDAYKIFLCINEPNVVSYSTMIGGFALNGFGEEALKVFTKMESEGKKPNDVTFLSLLSACAHTGLVGLGWKYFKSMKSMYEIEPNPDHYACMVDLLGKCGLLDEAYNLISSMPFEPHSGVWGSLLGSCKTYLHLDLAELAAKKLMELEPESATPYVVLSQLYYIQGEKRESNRLRNIKKSKRIKKNPGCSWILLGDKVHPFSVGDESHMNVDEIKVTLELIREEMELSLGHEDICY
ncbi:PREDICTED: pentatricopeptide repeat-containing protein At1g53600, mitochondrial [Tarenaya hassleriana]|uniref:pentatricopeptide repeat-containing protein At1g53600, mitochondrial n=1 Tax=Tarenaya hassleriana TaxID=28532 RepID=UPI00053C1A47|nr:PREDICTED: pentatricopeptide repeat-containing protein At1g53600, mitochondrial [Tarenaya hassleriana]XP_010535006.1 PREDICTED: pentatricopeptide repeat-containing protein At1g53600, mitochondrial [Tarenaya hassleriana]XP_010535007.1 PREDICTED: pentatricopeptide repeat-containing protein At1g53600, mitochondrial [Tarenaya hassleriana]XP_010535008.1 PREDICTED: pentatricopeptide repeat-containing protein At1g53600, mitochondrial [Tarenaya hassleriana]